jgi:hypothetical protein
MDVFVLQPHLEEYFCRFVVPEFDSEFGYDTLLEASLLPPGMTVSKQSTGCSVPEIVAVLAHGWGFWGFFYVCTEFLS